MGSGLKSNLGRLFFFSEIIKRECKRIYGGTYSVFKIQEKDREVKES